MFMEFVEWMWVLDSVIKFFMIIIFDKVIYLIFYGCKW